MSLQSNIKDSFSRHLKKMRNNLRVSIKINMAICHMGTNSSCKGNKRQQVIAQQVFENHFQKFIYLMIQRQANWQALYSV